MMPLLTLKDLTVLIFLAFAYWLLLVGIVLQIVQQGKQIRYIFIFKRP